MLNFLPKPITGFLNRRTNHTIPINWIRRNELSWLCRNLDAASIAPPKTAFSKKIDNLAQRTNRHGAQPLWEGYASNNIGGPKRMPDDVRTRAVTGDLYSYLVTRRSPETVVEFGTAFGVSGMYFLAGLEANKKGRLLTFEPNLVWAQFAQENLSEISNRFDLINGTFEENIEITLKQGQRIDLAFIDAIHTKDFVIPQLEIVIEHSNAGAIIILDDINFSDDMRECWEGVSKDSRFAASASLGGRVGIVELRTA